MKSSSNPPQLGHPPRHRRAASLRAHQQAVQRVVSLLAQVGEAPQAVLDAVAAAALDLCRAGLVQLISIDGPQTLVEATASRGAVPDADLRAAVEGVRRQPSGAPPCGLHEVGGVAVIALVVRGRPTGVIAMNGASSEPLQPAHAVLLQTLADVAAIAIEGRRQTQALQMRERYLADALEQHAATSKMLHVILRSTTDPQLVFDTIAVAVTRLCGAAATNVIMYDGALLHAAAIGIHDPAGVAEVRRAFPRPADRSSIAGRVVLSRSVVAIHDMLADTEVLSMATWGFRSVVGVPMLRDGEPIGVIAVGRYPTGPFPEQQIALLKTFADQAVIAIENARLFREVDAQRRQLETASEHKSNFLTNVSHELRTPLNAIIGFTRIVSRHSLGLLEPLQLENLGKILRSAKDLLSLINSLLDLSKVEAGHIEIETAPVALAPLLEQCLHTVEPLLRRSVELASVIEHALPTLLVDGEKLRQIVVNLLANAAKFTAAGRIELRARSHGASVEIAVTDTGIGIARDKLALVFEPFEQADPSTTREHGGSGLGLAIARRLARLMQGDIAVQSAVGVGSTFTLSLPLHYGNPER